MPIAARPESDAPRAPERILAAALAAFAEHGFHGATTRGIAARAGVPQGLVAYHFASKQVLWESAADWIFGQVRADFEQAAEALRDVEPAARLRAALKRFARFVARHPELHRFMTHEGSHDGPRLRWLVDRHVRPLFEISTALIREAIPEVDAAQLHYALVGAVAHRFAVAPEFARVTARRGRTRETEQIDTDASEIVDWLIDGALARRGRGGGRATVVSPSARRSGSAAASAPGSRYGPRPGPPSNHPSAPRSRRTSRVRT